MLPLIEDRPKALLDIKGKSILERQVETLNACNIKDIVVVRGYQKDKFTLPNIRYYDNEQYEKNFDLASLFCAEAELRGRCLVLYGDILFDRSVLEKLLQSDKDISLVVDRAWYDQRRDVRPDEAHPSRTWCCCAIHLSRGIDSSPAPLTPRSRRLASSNRRRRLMANSSAWRCSLHKGWNGCSRPTIASSAAIVEGYSTRQHLWSKLR